MKSFRLDPNSVNEIVQGWPFFLITIPVGLITGWLATKYEWVRILVPITFGIALGPRFFGQLRERLPTAKHLWLLSTGMTTCLVGVTARMAFPSWQGAKFDLSWLGVAFVTLLAFLLINRRNREVVG